VPCNVHLHSHMQVSTKWVEQRSLGFCFLGFLQLFLAHYHKMPGSAQAICSAHRADQQQQGLP